MNFQIIAFGITRDILGKRKLAYEVSETPDVSDLLSHLRNDFPELVRLTSLRIAVNEEYVKNDHRLSEGDEIVLIPPVSGG